MAHPISFLLIVMMCCAHLPQPPYLLSSFARSSLSLFAMQKVEPRNKLGAIVHAVLDRVLSNHAVKNIYVNVNYVKTFLQGTAMHVFEGFAPGVMNALWKLTDLRLESNSRGSLSINSIAPLGRFRPVNSINLPELAPYLIAFASPLPPVASPPL